MINIQNCLSSEHQYSFLKGIKDSIKANDEKTLTIVIESIQEILRSGSAIQKVLSVRFIKELMDLHLSCIIDQVSLYILPIYYDFAVMVQDHKLAFSQFPPEEEKTLSVTFMRLILECIFVWGLWHPHEINGNSSQYLLVYKALQDQNIIFPKLHYFQAQQVKQYYEKQKADIARNAHFQTSQVNSDQEFQRLKEGLETGQFTKQSIKVIHEALQRISPSNQYQQFFLREFRKAYQEFQKNGDFEELKISIQASCLGYDDGLVDKPAELDNLSHSKIQGSGCSQFLSQESFRSHMSTPMHKDQHLILSEKDKKIEQLLMENRLLAEQIERFEKQINSMKNSVIKTDINSD